MPMFSFTKASFNTTSIENCNPNLWFPPGNFFGCVNLLLTLGWSNMATDHPPSSSRIFQWSNNQTALFPCWKPWLTWDFLYIFLDFPWDFPTFVLACWNDGGKAAPSEVWLCHNLSLHPRGWGPLVFERFAVQNDLFIDDLLYFLVIKHSNGNGKSHVKWGFNGKIIHKSWITGG